MNSFKSVTNITGWLVFAIAAVVYMLTAESTGSLWDCGEFILGAYKMEVVHPPGAPLFMIVGRMFIWIAEIFTDTEANPENIAYSVNLLSGLCTAFGAMMVCWAAMILGKMSLVGRSGTTDLPQNIALMGMGLATGLATTFASSIWFSAVEGEVYAMSTFFTCLTFWCTVKWYHLPNTPYSDRWLVFTVYAGALSMGVHLLSLLTFPALALFYYFKKYKEHTFKGMIVAVGAGMLTIVAIQKLVITGIAEMWRDMELITVNGFGMPFHSGLIPTMLIIAAIFYFGLRLVGQPTGNKRPVRSIWIYHCGYCFSVVFAQWRLDESRTKCNGYGEAIGFGGFWCRYLLLCEKQEVREYCPVDHHFRNDGGYWFFHHWGHFGTGERRPSDQYEQPFRSDPFVVLCEQGAIWGTAIIVRPKF